jgi:hypothetical protein
MGWENFLILYCRSSLINLGGDFMKWLDERKTWEELRNMILMCCLWWDWAIICGIIWKVAWCIALVFTVLVAIRCIYLRLAPSLYQGKLDKLMNNVIAILNTPIYIALVALFAGEKFRGIVL